MPTITFVLSEIPRVGERVGLQHEATNGGTYHSWEATDVIYLENLVERSWPRRMEPVLGATRAS